MSRETEGDTWQRIGNGSGAAGTAPPCFSACGRVTLCKGDKEYMPAAVVISAHRFTASAQHSDINFALAWKTPEWSHGISSHRRTWNILELTKYFRKTTNNSEHVLKTNKFIWKQDKPFGVSSILSAG